MEVEHNLLPEDRLKDDDGHIVRTGRKTEFYFSF